MKNLYCFSGLGADERVYEPLDFSGYHPVYIRWEQPLPHETISAYAKRLCDQITDERPVLVGLSFGGMIALEAARHVNAEKVIVIASAKTRSELPLLYRAAGILRLDKLVPVRLLKQANWLVYYAFGARTTTEKTLLRSILSDTDPQFLRWAIGQIVRWKNTTVPAHTFHLHGTNDRLLPFRKVTGAIAVQGGGHFMTVNKAAEVSVLLRSVLAEIGPLPEER